MQRARFGFVRTVVALTANRTLNSVFVSRAKDRFNVPRGLVSTSEAGVGLVQEQVGSGAAEIVFDGPHDVERWEVRGRRGDVGIEYFVYEPVEPPEPSETTKSGGLSERFVILTIDRDGETRSMFAKSVLKPGDIAAIAVHLPEREECLRDLAARGWKPTTLPTAETEDAPASDGEEDGSLTQAGSPESAPA